MADALDQQIDAFLRGHFLEVKAEREDNSRTTMHAPEEHSDSVLRRLWEVHVPQQQFPVKRPALAPERRAEQAAVRAVASRHEALQMMPRNQFMKYRGARKMNVVAAHAHELLLVRHRVGRIRNT